MRPRSTVRAAKCQMLVTCCFVWLLGLSVATMAALTHFGDHFAIISRASLERNPFEAMHRWAFYLGISLAGLLSLGAALSAAATVREAQGLMAGGFLCFALVFCTLAQVAFWRFRNPTQVEDAVLDTYDLVYDQAVRSPSSIQWQELTAIHDTDCLQSIRGFLQMQQNIASTLTSTGLALMVYAMLLSSFLWSAIRSSCDLDRKGKYILTPRVDPHFNTPLKHVLWLAIGVQEDAWMTFSHSRLMIGFDPLSCCLSAHRDKDTTRGPSRILQGGDPVSSMWWGLGEGDTQTDKKASMEACRSFAKPMGGWDENTGSPRWSGGCTGTAAVAESQGRSPTLGLDSAIYPKRKREEKVVVKRTDFAFSMVVPGLQTQGHLGSVSSRGKTRGQGQTRGLHSWLVIFLGLVRETHCCQRNGCCCRAISICRVFIRSVILEFKIN